VATGEGHNAGHNGRISAGNRAKPSRRIMPYPERPLPHVSIATFCERVIQDKTDDVMSVIRMYDTVTVPASAKGQFADLSVVIGLRSGEARGTYNLEFLLYPPAGGARVRLSTPGPVEFKGDEQGVTFGLQIHTMLQEPGLDSTGSTWKSMGGCSPGSRYGSTMRQPPERAEDWSLWTSRAIPACPY
jgi:hypothetical protein